MSERNDTSAGPPGAPEDFELLRQIELELGQQAADREPKSDWQARVFARIAERETSRQREQSAAEPAALQSHEPSLVQRLIARWTLALPAAAAFAALAVFVLWPRTPELALAAHAVHPIGTQPTLAAGDEEINPGDVLQAAAQASALRIYHDDDALVLACPGDSRCRASNDRISADFVLPLNSTGTYRVLAFSSSSIPALPGNFLADRSALRQADIKLLNRFFHVR